MAGSGQMILLSELSVIPSELLNVLEGRRVDEDCHNVAGNPSGPDAEAPMRSDMPDAQ